MSKVKVLRSATGVSVELGSYYKWWEVNLADGSLTTSVCLDGTALQEPITPKQLRKIAKTLLKLADEVDPPAPKVEYSAATCGLFYRQRATSPLEVWENNAGYWTPSLFPTIEEQRRDNGEDDSWPIAAAELPEGAR